MVARTGRRAARAAGPGASVAYGATPLALGTDGGGSIRIPSAFCGVVGHKPTFGLVPKLPGFRGWPTLSVDGPLARSVRDLALALSVMAGPSPPDDMTYPVPIGRLPRRRWTVQDLSGLRVAYSEDLGWADVDPVVRAAFADAVDSFGARPAPRWSRPPGNTGADTVVEHVALAEGYASEGPLLDQWADSMSAGIAEIVRGRPRHHRLAVPRRVHERRRLHPHLGGVLHPLRRLLLPAMPLTAFGVGEPHPASIDGHPVDPFFDDWCTLAMPANLTGQPSTAVPTGLGNDGLPMALQVMAPRFGDATSLSLAAAFERVLPGLFPPDLPPGGG